MIKSVMKVGDSFAIEIEESVLSQLGATPESSFEVVTDGTSLILTPLRGNDRHERFQKAVEQIGERYGKTFRELA